MYFLDTNTLIYFFKGMGNVADNLFAKKPDQIALPAVVYYELLVGIAKSDRSGKRQSQLNELVSLVTFFPFGEREAQASAQIRARLEKTGTPIGPTDILIAGTALGNQGVLVTHNIGEFQRVQQLAIEDWY
ncbi:MAG TPA: type II toxin-antitoxin system VapC family toxin [Calditrichia bacterium]|nr:type II toxin-antitoxin system VapC family toxin [Calditrichota bacterium]HQU73149.1 type II toxin-antitoxin system VapC family toxin [Calditrichia bacterium]HQV30457.1 type II toxin-antitoxin system VapC family toxin [Calditrichia bacterium]